MRDRKNSHFVQRTLAWKLLTGNAGKDGPRAEGAGLAEEEDWEGRMMARRRCCLGMIADPSMASQWYMAAGKVPYSLYSFFRPH